MRPGDIGMVCHPHSHRTNVWEHNFGSFYAFKRLNERARCLDPDNRIIVPFGTIVMVIDAGKDHDHDARPTTFLLQDGTVWLSWPDLFKNAVQVIDEMG